MYITNRVNSTYFTLSETYGVHTVFAEYATLRCVSEVQTMQYVMLHTSLYLQTIPTSLCTTRTIPVNCHCNTVLSSTMDVSTRKCSIRTSMNECCVSLRVRSEKKMTSSTRDRKTVLLIYTVQRRLRNGKHRQMSCGCNSQDVT